MPADGDPAAESGPDLARAALARARAKQPARRRPQSGDPRPRRAPGGAGEDRDPVRLGETLAQLVSDRGWQAEVSAAGVVGRWDQIAGQELAAHCRAEGLEERTLLLVAESTAWATQLRLLERVLLDRIAQTVGPGVVTRLRVRGPVTPDWRHGSRRVRGRGPRDTYG